MTQDSHDEKRRKHMAVMDDKKSDKTMVEYRYIGKDGKPILARDLEDQRDELQVKLNKAVAILDRIGSAQTSGGGQASVMAFHAREALAEIKGETT